MVGRGTGDAVPLRAAGALIGPDGLAVRWTRIGCACGAAGGPTAVWGCDRRASTMFQKPPKRVCDPRMRDQSAVNVRRGAPPTGAPVAVRVKKRNYGDGWIKPEDLELRNAIKLPAWTRVPAQVRRILAAERAGQR